MNRPVTNAKATRTRVGAFARVLALGGISVSCAAAAAQYQVQQDGRLFDANPQVGSGGMNYVRPVSPLMGGNSYASGNMRGGLSLRSYSPISDPTAFRGALGSTSLSTFRRDSFSVSDGLRAAGTPSGWGTLGSSVYRDPSSTVPTAGLLSGQTSPYGGLAVGTSIRSVTPATISSISPIDARIDAQSQWATPSRLGTLSGPMTSSIFGMSSRRTSAATGMNELTSPLSGLADLPMGFTGRPSSAADEDVLNRAPLSPEPLGTPMDLVLGNQPIATYLDRRRGMEPDSGNEIDRGMSSILTRETRQDVPARDVPTETVLPGFARVVDPSVLPGYDVFGDMRMALALERDPGATWYRDAQAVARARPELQDQMAAIQDRESSEYASQMLDQPLGSFVGKGQSAVNDELLKAEALLDIGHYYEAAARYEGAARLDPGNPLPLLGRGHALLAAGEYSTAALLIERGLSIYPDAARFRINLIDLMGGGEIIDVRRSDLMRRLDVREDVRLRFLLGYLEYHGGDRTRGMENLKRAAEGADPTSIIARYPTLLEGSEDLGMPRPRTRPGREPTAPAKPTRSIFEEVVVPPPVDVPDGDGQDTPGE